MSREELEKVQKHICEIKELLLKKGLDCFVVRKEELKRPGDDLCRPDYELVEELLYEYDDDGLEINFFDCGDYGRTVLLDAVKLKDNVLEFTLHEQYDNYDDGPYTVDVWTVDEEQLTNGWWSKEIGDKPSNLAGALKLIVDLLSVYGVNDLTNNKYPFVTNARLDIIVDNLKRKVINPNFLFHKHKDGNMEQKLRRIISSIPVLLVDTSMCGQTITLPGTQTSVRVPDYMYKYSKEEPIYEAFNSIRQRMENTWSTEGDFDSREEHNISDLLGVYYNCPRDNDKDDDQKYIVYNDYYTFVEGLIYVWLDKIYDYAKKDLENSKALLKFVVIHEYCHALLDVNIYGVGHNTVFTYADYPYLFIEETVTSAYALMSVFSQLSNSQQKFVEQFVKSQSTAYVTGWMLFSSMNNLNLIDISDWHHLEKWMWIKVFFNEDVLSSMEGLLRNKHNLMEIFLDDNYSKLNFPPKCLDDENNVFLINDKGFNFWSYKEDPNDDRQGVVAIDTGKIINSPKGTQKQQNEETTTNNANRDMEQKKNSDLSAKFEIKDGELIIPEGTKVIENSAFSYRKELTSVIIPDSVTKISEAAFSNCKGLTSVTIPDSVTSIGDRAFEGCSALDSLSLPDSLKEIGESAFADCNSLKGDVIIPDSVVKFGDNIFRECPIRGLTLPAAAVIHAGVEPKWVNVTGEKDFLLKQANEIKELLKQNGLTRFGYGQDEDGEEDEYALYDVSDYMASFEYGYYVTRIILASIELDEDELQFTVLELNEDDDGADFGEKYTVDFDGLINGYWTKYPNNRMWPLHYSIEYAFSCYIYMLNKLAVPDNE